MFIVLSLLSRAGEDLENHLQVGKPRPREGKGVGQIHGLMADEPPQVSSLSLGPNHPPQAVRPILGSLGGFLHCKATFASVLKVKKNLKTWFH